MAGMNVVLALMLLVGVAHGYTIDQPDAQWQFSDVANTAGADGQQGGHIVPDNGFQYHFDQYEGAGVSGNPQQFSQSSYLPEGQEDSSFSDEAFVGDDGALHNDPAPYDYNNRNVATRTDEPSFAVGVPEVRGSNPDYVYDASAGTGPDTTSFSSHGDEVVTSSDPDYVYDATTSPPADGESFTALNTPPTADDQAVSSGHSGPISYYTPASDPNGAFNFYDARSDDEKKTVSFTDDDSSDGAAVLTDHADDTTASTSPVLAAYKPAVGTHGCPSNFWATHTKQWPKQIKITTLVCKAFDGVNLKKNLEIIYGSTTVFQALLDTRADPYSKLLRNAVAALLNAYARQAFTLKPAQVSKLFHSALASKTAAAAQSQKFENENHAFGDSECK